MSTNVGEKKNLTHVKDGRDENWSGCEILVFENFDAKSNGMNGTHGNKWMSNNKYCLFGENSWATKRPYPLKAEESKRRWGKNTQTAWT